MNRRLTLALALLLGLAATPAATAGEPPAGATRSDDPDAVEIRVLTLVLERDHELVRVTENLSLAARPGTVFTSPAGLAVPLPLEARAARAADDGATGFTVSPRRILIRDPIPDGGLELEVAYALPVADGAVTFGLPLDRPARLVRIISTLADETARLTVAGLGKPERREMDNGLVAWVVMGRDLPAGRLVVRLDGLSGSSRNRARLAALFATAGLFALGLGARWWRRKQQPA